MTSQWYQHCANDRKSRIHWRIHPGGQKKLNVSENKSSDKKTNYVHVVRFFCAIPISRVFWTFTP